MKKNMLKSKRKGFVDFLKNNEKSKNTIKHYEHVITIFTDAMPDDFDKSNVIDFKQDMISNLKVTTVNNYITIINKYLVYCGGKKLTVEHVKVQKDTTLEEVMEPSDFKRMLRHAKLMGMQDMYMLMKIMAYTGIRVEERSHFTVEKVQENYIKVNNKGRIRTVIIRSDLRRELIKYCKENDIKEGYIFISPRDHTKLLSVSTIWERMKRIAGHANVKKSKIHPHSFRHLFAITFISSGGDVTELADILGHSSIATTRIYTRTTDKQRRKKLEKLKY